MDFNETFFKPETIALAISNMDRAMAKAYERREPMLLISSHIGIHGHVAIQAFAITLGWPEEVAVLDVYSEHCLAASEEAEEWLNDPERPWHLEWSVEWSDGSLWALPYNVQF